MNSRDITVYLDERWCNALESSTGRKMEVILQERVDALIQQLPPEVRLPIEADIRREEQQRAHELDANRRFAVFRVTKDGQTHYCRSDHGEDFLGLGIRLRQYLRSNAPDASQLIPKAELIPADQAERFTAEMLRGSPRVTGIFNIDLDEGEASTLEPSDGWHRFRNKDVSTAVYYAVNSQSLWEKRYTKFQKGLEGKELPNSGLPILIRGESPLPVDELCFEEEISQMEHLLNFYIPVTFNADKVFGTFVETKRNDDWINVYANYDLRHGQVCDTLEVYLVRGNNTELDCEYRLSSEEKAVLRSEMDDYCMDRLGYSLSEAQQHYISEHMSDSHSQNQDGPTMEQMM